MDEEKVKKTFISKQATLIIISSLGVLCVLSSFLLYNAYSEVLEETEYKTIYDYTMMGEYSYEAHLKENTLYNKTVVTPVDGELYLPIIEYLDLSFKFTFFSPNGVNVLNTTITPYYEVSKQDVWRKTFNKDYFPSHGTNPLITRLDFNEIKDVVAKIDLETGLRTSSYDFTITTYVYLTINSFDDKIDDVFTPKIIFTVYSDFVKGQKIEASELFISRNEKNVEEIVIVNNQILIDRSNYTLTTTALLILFLSSVYYYATRFMDLKKTEIDELKEYKDIVFETTTNISTKDIIDVIKIKDLVNIANVLMKPILKIKKEDTITLYIKDKKTHYRYIININQEYDGK